MSTQAYVDLMFAWGHARLGDEETARRLVAEAANLLRPSRNKAHEWLLDAFSYRVQEAIAGHAHAGSLPAALTDTLAAVDDYRKLISLRYVADRLRQLSRILDPEDRIDPYLPWKKGIARKLHPLEDLLHGGQSDQVPERYEELRRQAEWSGDPIEASRFHGTVLQFRGATAELLGELILSAVETFATNSLTRRWADHPEATTWFNRHRPRPEQKDKKETWGRYHVDAANPGAWVENSVYSWASSSLESACEFAAAIERPNWIERLAERFLALQLGSELSVNARRRLGAITERISRVLIRLDLPELGTRVCDRLGVERLAADIDGGPDEPMSACLALAKLNLWLGRPGPAGWVLDRTRERLPRIEKPGVQANVIVNAVELVAQLEWTECAAQLRALLGALPRLPNSFTTATHFSRFHVVIAEAFILAITTNNFGPPADLLRSMPAAEITARREALAEVRGRLVEWGRPDWGPPTRS